MRIELTRVCAAPSDPIRQVMAVIEGGNSGVALIVDTDRRLLGIVTDGDIRRGFLHGLSLESRIEEAMNRKPMVVPASLPTEAIQHLMRANTIRHMPVVDEAGYLVALESLDEAAPGELATAVIMAGGEGLRLRPLTESMPKPMLRVGGKPLIEILVSALRRAGFGRILINIRYLGEVIEQHFGDGSAFGLEIRYLREPKPLGTAGGISLIPPDWRPRSPFVVLNGDLLTRLNFGVFRDFHMSSNYTLTLCGRPYDVRVPFGYPVASGDVVTEFREKPTFTFLVNSGIYCLNPELIDEIPYGEPFDMPTLVHRVCESKRPVGLFPLREPFHEIGRIESYEAAERFYREHFQDVST